MTSSNCSPTVFPTREIEPYLDQDTNVNIICDVFYVALSISHVALAFENKGKALPPCSISTPSLCNMEFLKTLMGKSHPIASSR